MTRGRRWAQQYSSAAWRCRWYLALWAFCAGPRGVIVFGIIAITAIIAAEWSDGT